MFKNRHHLLSLSAELHSMQKRGQLCDIILVVKQSDSSSEANTSSDEMNAVVGKVSAHRVVLSAAMPYFRALFSPMTNVEKEQMMIERTIEGIDIDSLNLLVEYGYTGEISINEQNVKPLILAAKELEVSLVLEACLQFLTEQLNPSNCLSIHSFAVQHKFTELAKTAHKYSLENLKVLVLSKDFLLLSFNEILNIISSNELIARNEELVYNAVMSWIKEDLEERERHLEQLLPQVRLSLMDPKVLALNVAKESLIVSKTFGKDLILEAMAQHFGREESAAKRETTFLKPYIFVIGGVHTSKSTKHCGYYNPRSNQWSSSATTSEFRSRAGVAAVNAHIYAIGGYKGTEGLSSAEVFDPLTNKWTNIRHMETTRYELGVAALNGSIFVAGGRNAGYLKCVEHYNPSLDKWSAIKAMQTHRHGFRLTSLNGCLYAVGGFDGTECLASVERLDPRAGKWHSIAKMSNPRQYFGAASLDQFVYVVGGKTGGQTIETGERFDPFMNRWEEIASLPSKRNGHELVECDGRLYAIGGHDGTKKSDSVESYDISKQVWTTVTSIELGLFFGAAVLYCTELEGMTTE